MKIYIASRRFDVSRNVYYEVPEGTMFIHKGKYKMEIDPTRYPAIISLSKEKFEEIKSTGNGNLSEINVKDERIEQIFTLNEERKKKEAKIKGRIKSLCDKLDKEIFYKSEN